MRSHNPQFPAHSKRYAVDVQSLLEEARSFHRAGSLDDAAKRYEQIVEIHPTNADALSLLGEIACRTGRLAYGVELLSRAIEQNPHSPVLRYNLALVLQRLNDPNGALKNIDQAIALKPNYPEAHNNQGNLLRLLGRSEEAIISFDKAISLRPDYVLAYNNRGSALREIGRFDDALESYEKAIALRGDLAEVHYNRGNVLVDLKCTEEALTSFDQAIAYRPDFAEAFYNRGRALDILGRKDEALASYDSAIAVKPNYANAYNGRGMTLCDLKRPMDAAESYEKAISLQGDFADAQFNLALLQLSLGHFKKGWPLFETRYHSRKIIGRVALPSFPFPQWKGESLAGKSLIVIPEQGFGDYIQFIRYAVLLKERGVAHLTILCPPALQQLLQTAHGVDEVVTDVTSVSLHDYWSFPLTFPFYFETEISTIPAKLPYLRACPNKLARWSGRLSTDLIKVGLVWKGSSVHQNDAWRSLPSLTVLSPLWSVKAVQFFSLQKGQGEDEAVSCPSNQPLIHLGSDIEDFADTAAIVSQLDLVICIDTAIAHVAGALGKACWVLLPACGTDWRWLLERDDSPWYPKIMRLFRQSSTESWGDTIKRVSSALSCWKP